MKLVFSMNTISWDLTLRWVSDGYPILLSHPTTPHPHPTNLRMQLSSIWFSSIWYQIRYRYNDKRNYHADFPKQTMWSFKYFQYLWLLSIGLINRQQCTRQADQLLLSIDFLKRQTSISSDKTPYMLKKSDKRLYLFSMNVVFVVRWSWMISKNPIKFILRKYLLNYFAPLGFRRNKIQFNSLIKLCLESSLFRVGYLAKFLHSWVFLPFFYHHKIIGFLLNITLLCNKCHYSSDAVTAVKYQCDFEWLNRYFCTI